MLENNCPMLMNADLPELFGPTSTVSLPSLIVCAAPKLRKFSRVMERIMRAL
jgi:hypothetical protein